MRALSRKKAYRTSTLRNLATSLILYEKITTTEAKAKELKPIIEHLINLARKKDLTAKRRLLGFFFDENAVKKVLEDLVPRYKNIKTGFIHSYRKGRRLGDGAEMIILELEKPASTAGGEKVEIKEGKDAKEKSSKDTEPKNNRKKATKPAKTK